MVSNKILSLFFYISILSTGIGVSAAPPEYDGDGLLKCPWEICHVDGSFPPYCNKGEICKPCWHFTFFGACVDENAEPSSSKYLPPTTSIPPVANLTNAPTTEIISPVTEIPCDPDNSNTCPEGYVCVEESSNRKCVREEPLNTPSPRRPQLPKTYPINCPDNFTEVGNSRRYSRCLLYQEDPKTLAEAHRKCLADGGALASASHGMEGFERMKDVALSKSKGAPVSIWHEYLQGKGRWKPHCITFPGGKCDPGKQEKLPYFCEYYKINPCGPQADNEHWHYRDGQCFKAIINRDGMSFDAARNACQAYGADLAVINSMGKNELLRRLLEEENLMEPDYQHHDPLDNAWIGLYHDGKKLRWTDGEEEKILVEGENKGKYPWAKGEPGDDSNEKCTEVKTGDQGLWNDLFCYQPLRAAICSRKFALV